MKSDPQINQALNQVLKQSLTSINQYVLHARMLSNWGLEKLNQVEYAASIHAMKEADRLINRILFLEGLPNLQDLGKLLIGENVQEILSNDLEMDTQYRHTVAEAIKHCETVHDYQSREHLEEIQEHIEARIDWLESQLWLIDKTGMENYIQANTGENE